jgi:MazG family protein
VDFPDEGIGVLGLHEGLPDQNSIGPCSAGSGSIFECEDAAFADLEDATGNLRNQALGQREVGGESTKVAVVDSDDACFECQGAFEVAFIVDFKKGIEPSQICGIEQCPHLIIVQCTYNDQHDGGSCFGCLHHLDRVHHEVLSQAGDRALVLDQQLHNLPKVAHVSPEKALVGEDGERVCLCVEVADRLIFCPDAFCDRTSRRGTPFDFRNDGELVPVLLKHRGKQEVSRIATVGKANELPFGNWANDRSDFLALPVHDFCETIRHWGLQQNGKGLDYNPIVHGTAFRYPETSPEFENTWRFMSENHSQYAALLTTVARLRAPGGCPWDREQTHESLTECLIEECAELLEAIDHRDYSHMKEELGDLLLNVIMQAEIAGESGHFSMEDVCREINEKLIRRHPHVFGDASGKAEDSGTVLKRWDAIKLEEAKASGKVEPDGPFKSLPPRLPSLLFAKKVWKQIEKGGMVGHAALPAQRMEELDSTLDQEGLAESLFAIAALCRKRGLDPEWMLRKYTQDIIEALS